MGLTLKVRFDVIFDNAGGIQLQTYEGVDCDKIYCHFYGTDAKQAAEDVYKLLAGGNTEEWDGNEPCFIQQWREDDGQIWRSDDQVVSIITSRNLGEFDGASEQEFFDILRVMCGINNSSSNCGR